MPLAALLDGELKLAPLLTQAEITELREIARTQPERLVVRYSGWQCFLRTSKLGTLHFAHRPGYDGPLEHAESLQHIALKAELVRALAAQGYTVDSEVPNADRSWIADVLAEGHGRRVAFEVQWSRQTATRYVFRQQRYAAEGVECVWLVREPPRISRLDEVDAATLATVPLLPLVLPESGKKTRKVSDVEPDEPFNVMQVRLAVPSATDATVDGLTTIAIPEFTDAVMTGRLEMRTFLPLRLKPARCDRCGKTGLYWRVGAQDGSRSPGPESDPTILQYVARFSQQVAPDVRTAKIGPWQTYARTFKCPHCGVRQTPDLDGGGTLIRLALTEKALAFQARWQLTVASMPLLFNT